MKKMPFSAALPGARILIVEDEAILAMDLENRLKGEGCDVIGEEAKALKLVEQGRPDAVVLNLNLNGKPPTDLVDAWVKQQTRI
jgi:DNA-binding response OmpR family regulator